MANRNFPNNKLYQFESYPVLVSCNFNVTPTNGLGITNLKGGGVRNVFMHTSTTPSANNGYTNPNPEDGVIAVQLQDNYNKFLGLISAQASLTDGSSQTSTTAGRLSVISVLGTATLAQWQAKGLPVGVTPALGVAFIATASGSIGNSGAVQRPLWSGISSIEIGANPNLTLAPSNSPVNGGSWLFFQTLKESGTNSAPAFTGTAMTAHAHDLLIKGGQAAASTAALAWYATNILGKEAATDQTILGADSATKGGVIAASAGTPAGTVAAPTFTASNARVAPVAGSTIYLSFYLSNSSVLINGQ